MENESKKTQKDKKRICFLTEYFSRGGIGRVTSVLMNALAQEKWCEVYSLTYAKENKDNISSYSIIGTINRSYLLDKHVTMKKAILQEHIISKLKAYLKENCIDVLVACGDLFFPIAVFSRSRNCKVVCWDHTNPLVNSDQKFQRISRIIGFAFSNANVVLTKSALKIINDKRLSQKKKNYQIYNPIDPLLLQSKRYDSRSHKIISVGRLDYSKNFDRLLDIASEVFKDKRTAGWTWDIYGDGEKEEYNKLISKRDCLRLERKVFFQGHTSTLYNLYNDYAFYVMTSRYEGLPMTLLEAMAKGLPLVAFDILTGPSEIISNKQNGYLCSNNSNEEMVKCILNLIENEDERIRMSNNNSDYIKRFDISRIVREWEKMLLSIK